MPTSKALFSGLFPTSALRLGRKTSYCTGTGDVTRAKLALTWESKRYIFFPGLFFIIFSYFGSFMVVWGFGGRVLYWVFGVGVISWWGLEPVVWGLLGFLARGSLYKHKRINLGKSWLYNGTLCRASFECWMYCKYCVEYCVVPLYYWGGFFAILKHVFIAFSHR